MAATTTTHVLLLPSSLPLHIHHPTSPQGSICVRGGTLIIGPRRLGANKGEAYESGMTPVGTARKRFNVRFYLIAMVFLVFDVEVIFLYPWAATFSNLDPESQSSAVWLVRILFFLFTTVVAYAYGYSKGVFKFD